MTKPLHDFSIVYNSQIKRASKLADEICAFLKKEGQEVSACGSIQDETLQEQITDGPPDAVIVLGGDGTMLRASHLCAPANIPITGINLGTFGFLMEIQPEEWHDFLPRMTSGDYRIESRMLLEAEHLRGEKSLGKWLVVNEVVVCRGEFVRPIRVEAKVDGYSMASYVADGLIAATPTGSTAYALAAGGAILPPTQRNIIIVPIAPHLSPDQSIILSEGACVSFKVRSSHQAVFSIDGHDPVKMKNDDIVQIKSSGHNSSYIRFLDPGFFYRNLNRFLEQNPSFPNSREKPA